MNFCKYENYIKIDEYISENKDAIINDLMELVRVPSVQGKGAAGMPYGEECDRALRKTADIYLKHGFDSVIKRQGTVLCLDTIF